jgi:hypothetical protein
MIKKNFKALKESLNNGDIWQTYADIILNGEKLKSLQEQEKVLMLLVFTQYHAVIPSQCGNIGRKNKRNSKREGRS